MNKQCFVASLGYQAGLAGFIVSAMNESGLGMCVTGICAVMAAAFILDDWKE